MEALVTSLLNARPMAVRIPFPMRSIALLIIIASACPLRAQQPITATIDLRDQRNDRLEVELIVPQIGDAPLVFALPRIVPGIYGAMDQVFGFVETFREYPPRSFPPSFVPSTIMEQTLEDIKAGRKLREAFPMLAPPAK